MSNELRRPIGEIVGPMTACRKHCIECTVNEHKEIENCTKVKCHIYWHRFGHDPLKASSVKERVLTIRTPEIPLISPIRSIRKFCVECMDGNPIEVGKCTAPKCWLYPHRFGKDPRRSPKTAERVSDGTSDK